MKSAHRKLLGLSIIAALLILPGMFAWKAYRQERLNSALITAIKHNDTGTAIALLAVGADANVRDVPTGNRVLWQQLWDRLRGKSSPTLPAPPALLLAVQGTSASGMAPENVPLVKALLDKGADVNSRDAFGMTALMWAALSVHPATVQLLLDKGADTNIQGSAMDGVVTVNSGGTFRMHQVGRTALQYAAEFDDVPAMKLLLQHGAKVDVRETDGGTLLIRAAGSGDRGQIRLLLANGAAVNATDKDGRAALMLAANSGYRDIISLLGKQGIDVNARDNKGETALMYSTEGPGDNPKTVQLLLKLGADPRIKSKTGLTALSIAHMENYTESIRILTLALAKK